MEMLLEIISILATIMGVIMSLSHFLQAHKIYKRKSSKDISLSFILIFTVGGLIWFAYGILINEWPVIISFGIAVIGTLTSLMLTLKYR